MILSHICISICINDKIQTQIIFINYFLNNYYFSQLAFRASHAFRDRKVREVHETLGNLESVNEEATLNLNKAVRQHLKSTADIYPMGDLERQVANQVPTYIL